MSAFADASVSVTRAAVWDLPVRVVHWSLVALLAALWWTGEQRMLDWHSLAGYALAGLVLFRIAWGFAGSSNARFSAFLRSPRTVGNYLRREAFDRSASAHEGHNPAGGWSVLAMLLLLAIQVGLGTLAVDVDGLESGPFSYLIEFDSGRAAAEWHAFLFNLLLGLIAVHLAAVVFYVAYRRQELIRPMITGSRRSGGVPDTVRFAPLSRALGLAALSGLAVYAAVHFLGQV